MSGSKTIQSIIEDGLRDNLECEEILAQAMALDDFFSGGAGSVNAFVEYNDSRLGKVSGAIMVSQADLACMPHRVSISATRPRSFHIELLGYTDSHGPVRNGWSEIVTRYHKQMHK